MHRLPLYATAAAIHAVIAPTEAFGVADAELLKQLAMRERDRARKLAQVLGLDDKGIERLLALGVLADGLSAETIRELQGAGVCGPCATRDFAEALAKTSWWKSGRLIRLEPDPLAAVFLATALCGENSLAEPARLSDWLFLALRENAASFGVRLGRILYDLIFLAHESAAAHAVDTSLAEMLSKEPARAQLFQSVVTKDVSFLSADFVTRVALILAAQAKDLKMKALFLNVGAFHLFHLEHLDDALAAAQEAEDLYRALAQTRPRAFTFHLAHFLVDYANILSGLGRREEALKATQEAVDLFRGLARSQPEAFAPHLGLSLNNLANKLPKPERRREALAAAEEAVDLFRGLARSQPEAFTPRLALSLKTLANSPLCA